MVLTFSRKPATLRRPHGDSCGWINKTKNSLWDVAVLLDWQAGETLPGRGRDLKMMSLITRVAWLGTDWVWLRWSRWGRRNGYCSVPRCCRPCSQKSWSRENTRLINYGVRIVINNMHHSLIAYYMIAARKKVKQMKKLPLSDLSNKPAVSE